MADTNDFRNKNTKFAGSDSIIVPKGASGDRNGTPEVGMVRYNTTLGFLEQYNAAGWAGIDAPPTVTNSTGTIFATTDSTITVTGSNFKSGSVVYITGAGVSNVERALSTTFVNSSELTAATNASVVNFVGGASYNVKVVNPSGLSAVLEPAGDVDSPPAWQTSAGTLATMVDLYDGVRSTSYSSGGTDYAVLTYRTEGTFEPTANFNVDALLVAGGGGGGAGQTVCTTNWYDGGGGGAGGMLEPTGVSVTSGTTYSISVGEGGSGAGSDDDYYGKQGGNTTGLGYTAVGGGGGETRGAQGICGQGSGPANGGSGGGRSDQAGVAGTGTSGQGNAGGLGTTPYAAGGGGGKGSAGSNAPSGTVGGNGGSGKANSITGSSVTYAGGGGGGVSNSGSSAGSGGSGGGGNGGIGNGTRQGSAGTDGLGGGGGGGGAGDSANSDAHGGRGGDGIMIIRYNKADWEGPLHATISATDPDGDSVSYSIISGSLPPGLSLNSSGQIRGYPEEVASDSNFSFTVRATSNSVNADRTFNIQVNKLLDGSESDRANTSASAIKSLTGTTRNGLYYIKPSGYGGSGFRVYCDMNTAGGGWMHLGTMHCSNDNSNEDLDNARRSPWAYGLHRSGSSISMSNSVNGIWGDSSNLDTTQSFTTDYKNGTAWGNVPFSQILFKDQGDSLRNLWYTNSGQIGNQSNAATYFDRGGNIWRDSGTTRANANYQVTVTNFGVSDDVFGGSPTRVCIFMGEPDGVEAANQDRSMITRYGSGDSVSATQGIGASRATISSNYQKFRDVDPTFRDEPGTISARYSYTMWVK